MHGGFAQQGRGLVPDGGLPYLLAPVAGQALQRIGGGQVAQVGLVGLVELGAAGQVIHIGEGLLQASGDDA